jgi:Protein kinase domain
MQPELIAGRYKVLRAIGRGGMGTVWLCRDEVLGREVAVKQIGALPGESPTATKRAMREARSAAALNHPNAVAVYDVVKHEDRPWLVMEYVEGQTLADEISRDSQISPQRVADIGAQLAGALARAHERRIVHRDIKPGNVLIDRAGRPKISDFGIARGHGDEQLTQVGFITGTPGYLSPELARGGDPHPASDVWALGATLYTAVEGQPPYEPRSNPIALLRAIASERPRPMTHAGVLAPALDAMMHEDPARRWDMATSAKRLASIARITQVMPRVDPVQTHVIDAEPLEPTQALAATQRLEVVAPVVAARVAKPPIIVPVGANAPVVAVPVVAKAPVVKPPAAAPPVVNTPVVAAPVAKAPVVAAPVVAVPVVATAPVVKPPVAAPPVVNMPVVAAPVAKTPVVAAPVVAAPPVVNTPVVAAPVAKMPAVALAAKTPGVRPPAAKAPLVATPVLPWQDRIRARRWLALLLIGMLAMGFAVTYLSRLSHQSGVTAVTTARSTSAKLKATSAPTISEQPTATGSAPSRATIAPVQNPNTRLGNFLTSYYSAVTKDTSPTWAQLTPSMQQRAGGRGGYDGWWKTVAAVKVNRTEANASGTSAVVSLTFTMTDGRRSTETHRFTFVSHNGGYLVDTDTPVS